MSGILVIAETKGGRTKKVSLEATTAGRRLCDQSGDELSVALVGEDLESLAPEFGTYGADRVFLIEGAGLARYSTEGHTSALAGVMVEKKPRIIIMGHSLLARDLAPRLAARLDIGLMADCVELSLEDGQLTALRPVYGGKALAKVQAVAGVSHFATIRPNVFTASQLSPPRSPETENIAAQVAEVRTRLMEERQEGEGLVDLTEAEVIVSGGRGLKTAENFKILEALAQVLGGAVGASRVAVDSGWRPHSEQVGQTGKVVNPKLYIACGISGSVQHLAGMGTSRTIVAINTDPEAPIFQKADYGIVGDLFTVVPLLTEELKKVMG